MRPSVRAQLKLLFESVVFIFVMHPCESLAKAFH
jgi:hypothetical protein